MVADPASKRTVHLSLVSSACLEHLEGESLFSSVAAGQGRYECEKLLKPNGIELVDLLGNANIEVSVLRRRGYGSDMQKQLLYRAVISLAAVRAITPGDDGDSFACAWEGWLGLLPIESQLNTLSPEMLFQKCVELGLSQAHPPSPRLLVRLQSLPPLSQRHEGSRFAASQSYTPCQVGLQWQGINPDKEMEALRLRSHSLEKQNEALKAELNAFRAQESEHWVNQVRWLLAKHGWQMTLSETKDPTEQVLVALGQILGQQEVQRPTVAKSFYKPVRSDPVDCLLAAELLRSGLRDVECFRLGAGQYQLGAGPRLSCYIESGRLMARFGEAEDQPMEFAKFISQLGGER